MYMYYSFSLTYTCIFLSNILEIFFKSELKKTYKGKMWQANIQKWPLYCNLTDNLIYSSKANSCSVEWVGQLNFSLDLQLRQLTPIEEHDMCYNILHAHAQMFSKLGVVAKGQLFALLFFLYLHVILYLLSQHNSQLFCDLHCIILKIMPA